MNTRQIFALFATLVIYIAVLIPVLFNEMSLRIFGQTAVATIIEKLRPKVHKGDYTLRYNFIDSLGHKVQAEAAINTFFNRSYNQGQVIEVLYEAGNSQNSIPKKYYFKLISSLSFGILIPLLLYIFRGKLKI